jgi:pimeloyl-ACP methyl ester carboxylesterase
MQQKRTFTFVSIMKRLTLCAMMALTITSCKANEVPENPIATANYHQTAKTQFIEAGGTRFAYRVLGDKQGIPLVFVSPLAGTMDDWDPAVTNGLAANYKVILFDNKGVGASSGKAQDNIADMARDAVTFIRALGYNKVNLLGFSMGGFITQQIVLTEPALVNRIILTGTGPKGSIGLSEVGKLFESGSNLSPDEQFLKFLFSPSAKSREAGKEAYARIQQRTVNRDTPATSETFGTHLAAVLRWAQPDANALNELKTVTQPALIVQGQQDLPVPVVNAINMSQYIPNARLVIYPDSGHGALFQYSQQFVHEVDDFLAAE